MIFRIYQDARRRLIRIWNRTHSYLLFLWQHIWPGSDFKFILYSDKTLWNRHCFEWELLPRNVEGLSWNNSLLYLAFCCLDLFQLFKIIFWKIRCQDLALLWISEDKLCCSHWPPADYRLYSWKQQETELLRCISWPLMSHYIICGCIFSNLFESRKLMTR